MIKVTGHVGPVNVEVASNEWDQACITGTRY